MKKSNVKQMTLCAILVSMALVLSYIERFIPLQMFVPLPGMKLDVFAVPNRFFGPSVTVTGLITGQDLISALSGRKGDQCLISCSMLREGESVFLDDCTLPQVESRAGIPIRVVQNRGEDFLRALWGL